MKPLWLIERGVYPDHSRSFKAEVERQNMICAEVDYRPGKFHPDDIFGCPEVAQDTCVVTWGTLPLIRQIQLRRGWKPGGWCNVERLACASYLAHFGDFAINGRCAIVRGVEAIEEQDKLFAEFGGGEEIFIRPNGVQKLLPGAVVHRDNFFDALAPARYDPLSLVVLSTPREIGREWRFVISADSIVASSQYRDNGAIRISEGCPAEVRDFADCLLRTVAWRPDPMFMLDVCESDGSLWLLELNSFSCSGWYDCDMAAVIQAASAAASEEWLASRSDD